MIWLVVVAVAWLLALAKTSESRAAGGGGGPGALRQAVGGQGPPTIVSGTGKRLSASQMAAAQRALERYLASRGITLQIGGEAVARYVQGGKVLRIGGTLDAHQRLAILSNEAARIHLGVGMTPSAGQQIAMHTTAHSMLRATGVNSTAFHASQVSRVASGARLSGRSALTGGRQARTQAAQAAVHQARTQAAAGGRAVGRFHEGPRPSGGRPRGVVERGPRTPRGAIPARAPRPATPATPARPRSGRAPLQPGRGPGRPKGAKDSYQRTRTSGTAPTRAPAGGRRGRPSGSRDTYKRERASNEEAKRGVSRSIPRTKRPKG